MSDEQRKSRIRDVVSQFVDSQSRGESITTQQVQQAHPDLLPELAEELNNLRLVAMARLHFERALDARVTVTHSFDADSIETAKLAVRCPHCSFSVEIMADVPWTDITCVGCGNVFSLVSDRLATREAPALKRVGHFELIERIGVGGFGTVWKARDTILDRTVALKLPRRGQLTEEEIDKFLREARAAAQLRHPNIVSVHEVGRTDDTVYIVSDLVRGVSLNDWMAIRSPSPREAAQLCHRIAVALDHAHRAGVVHRDLKPGNIMVDAADQPHIMDFGLAKRDVGEITMTIEGQVIGTPAYMAPEQARGQSHLSSPRTDVYSLGVVLFELMTGELPFRGNTNMLLHQVLNDEPPSPRKLNHLVPMDLETICLRCLEKDQARRFATAGELADELGRYLDRQPIHSRPLPPWARAARWCVRHRTVVGFSALTLLIVIVGTVICTRYAMLAAGAMGKFEKSQQETRAIQRNSESLAEEASDFFAAGTAMLRSPYNRQLQVAGPLFASRPDVALGLLEDESRCPQNLRDFSWRYFHRLCRRPHQTLRLPAGQPLALQFSLDGNTILAAVQTEESSVHLQQARLGRDGTWRISARQSIPTGPLAAAAFRPSDLALVYLSGTQLVARLPDGAEPTVLCDDARMALGTASQTIESLAFSPQGQFLAVVWGAVTNEVEGRSQLAIWDAKSRSMQVSNLPADLPPTTRIRIQEDGRHIDLLTSRGQVQLVHDPDSGKIDVSAPQELLQWPVGTLVSGDLFQEHRGQLTFTPRSAEATQLQMPVPAGTSLRAVVSPDQEMLAVVPEQGALQFWRGTKDDSTTWAGAEAVSSIEMPFNTGLCAVVTDSSIHLLGYELGRDILPSITIDRPVVQVAWAPDGSRLAYRDGEGTAWIVFLQGDRQLTEVALQTTCTCIAFENEDRLLLGTTEGQLMAWNVSAKSAETVESFKVPVVAVTRCQTSGAIVVAYGDDIRVLRKKAEPLELTGNGEAITHLSASDNGDCIVSCTEQGRVVRWRVNPRNDRVQRFEVKTTTTSLTTADVSADGATLATVQGNRVLLWDNRSGDYRGAVTLPAEITAARFAPLPHVATSQLFTCDVQGRLRVTSGYSFAQQQTCYVAGVVRGLASIADPPMIFCAGDNEALIRFPVAHPEQQMLLRHDGRATALAAAAESASAVESKAESVTQSQSQSKSKSNSSGRVAAALSAAGTVPEVVIYDVSPLDGTWEPRRRWAVTARVDQLRITRDGHFVGALMADRSLAWWDANTSQRAERADTAAEFPMCLALANDGQSMVVGAANGSLTRWQWRQGQFELAGKQERVHQGVVSDVQALGDGAWASVGSDDRLVISDAALQRRMAEVKHMGATSLAVHPSRTELTIAAGISLQQWTWDGTHLRRRGPTLTEHTAPITCATYSADGKYLVSASDDRSVKVWPLEQEPVVEKAIPPAVKALFESSGKASRSKK